MYVRTQRPRSVVACFCLIGPQITNLKPTKPAPSRRVDTDAETRPAPKPRQTGLTLAQLQSQYGHEEGQRKWDDIQAILHGDAPRPRSHSAERNVSVASTASAPAAVVSIDTSGGLSNLFSQLSKGRN